MTQRRSSNQIDALPEIPNVIVVDDDPEVREALSSLFRSVGLSPDCSAQLRSSCSTSSRRRRAVWCSTSGCPEWAASTSRLS